MIPDYRIKVNGKDITTTVSPLLINCVVSDSNGDESDTLRLELDDRHGQLAIPPLGAQMAIYLGWQGQPLINKGIYTIDEIEHQGGPDRLSLYGRSTPMTHQLTGKKSRSWFRVTLQQVVRDIAAEEGLTLVMSPELRVIKLASPQQTAESNLHFLTRLANRYDALANVKNNTLLFIKKGEGKTVSGKTLPTITVQRSDTSHHHYRIAKRDAYTGIKARWRSLERAPYQWVMIGKETRVTELVETFDNESAAYAAAEAELKRLNRGQAFLSVELDQGKPQVCAESYLTCLDFKKDINTKHWLITRVNHNLNERGLITQIEAESEN